MEDLKPILENKHCLNCFSSLSVEDAFCSKCGQKVDNNKLALKDVSKEFFENYISLDSRFGRSLIPFVFKPGLLAKKFTEGKRISFANPFRLYILSSIFFFFCLTSYINHKEVGANTPIFQISTTQLVSFEGLSQKSQFELNSKLSKSSISKLNSLKKEGFKKAYLGLSEEEQAKVIHQLSPQELNQFQLLADTTFLAQIGNKQEVEEEQTDINGSDIFLYQDSTHLSDEEVYEKVVKDHEISVFQEILFKRLIRITRADESVLRKYIIGNMSIAMFILIPLFALILKWFYRKRNNYFVAHLIHTLYLQSFAFFLFGFLFGLISLIPSLKQFMPSFLLILALVFLIHFIFSLKTVYEQRFKNSLFKGLLLIFAYLCLTVFVYMGEVLVSVILF